MWREHSKPGGGDKKRVSEIKPRYGGGMSKRNKLATRQRGFPPAAMTGAQARGAVAIGAVAVGAAAVGGFAIGRLSVGRLAIKRATIGKLKVEELEVGRLEVREQAQPGGAGRAG